MMHLWGILIFPGCAMEHLSWCRSLILMVFRRLFGLSLRYASINIFLIVKVFYNGVRKENILIHYFSIAKKEERYSVWTGTCMLLIICNFLIILSHWNIYSGRHRKMEQKLRDSVFLPRLLTDDGVLYLKTIFPGIYNCLMVMNRKLLQKKSLIMWRYFRERISGLPQLTRQYSPF